MPARCIRRTLTRTQGRERDASLGGSLASPFGARIRTHETGPFHPVFQVEQIDYTPSPPLLDMLYFIGIAISNGESSRIFFRCFDPKPELEHA
jgi:hypothetical protein